MSVSTTYATQLLRSFAKNSHREFLHCYAVPLTRAEHPPRNDSWGMRQPYACFKLRFGQFYGEGYVRKKAVGKVVAVCADKKWGKRIWCKRSFRFLRRANESDCGSGERKITLPLNESVPENASVTVFCASNFFWTCRLYSKATFRNSIAFCTTNTVLFPIPSISKES